MQEITPESVFRLGRRSVLKALGLLAAAPFPALAAEAGMRSSEMEITAESEATTYNNFYEFGLGKRTPAQRAKNFDTSGWAVRVGGLAQKPLTLTMPELLRRYGQTEHVYRLRCVEGWSMVIPWLGFSLGKLLDDARPESDARFVAFESYADAKQMPAVGTSGFPFPYLEGLRLDEAMFPLTIMATGAYGKPLPPQNGAPIRLIVPWKYGFKSLKSVIKINLTEKRPGTTWDTYNPHEYGFYANVNPHVPHRRWSQATERFIGAAGLQNVIRKPTLLFNGYDEVAPLYAGMDLTEHY